MRLPVLLLLAAVGFLVVALRAGHAGLAWGSVVLSAVAAAMILRRWRRSWQQLQDSPDDQLVLLEDEPATDAETGDFARAPASVTAVGETEAGSASAQQRDLPGQIESDEAERDDGQPGEEDTDAADLLVIYELADEVLVIDEQPRYHLARCRWPDHERAERLPVREARQLGFTPCDRCRPDTILARKYRAGRATTTAAAEPGQMQ
ncbi:MAG TPA: hypothetical protein VN748_01050 [Pseudonocardiaceae bacterium]|nr:hypothetical protein [Pseudonocardiaceae bacterium]